MTDPRTLPVDSRISPVGHHRNSIPNFSRGEPISAAASQRRKSHCLAAKGRGYRVNVKGILAHGHRSQALPPKAERRKLQAGYIDTKGVSTKSEER